MNRLCALLLAVVLAPLSALAADPFYYGDNFLQGIKGSLTQENLKQEIKRVLRQKHTRRPGKPDLIGPVCSSGGDCFQHSPIGYTAARKFLLGDFYLTQSHGEYAVREVYCEKEVLASEFGSKKPGPGMIPNDRIVNVEHTWPQSKFSSRYPKEEQKSDLHHLFPTDSEMNSTRSSFPFGEVSSDAKHLKCSNSRFGSPRASSEDVFEPPHAHKGNVARALFYFSVKYDLSIGAEEEATLRLWNREDPVDAEEMKRNDEIFALQFSRNPFVDFPEVVERISDF